MGLLLGTHEQHLTAFGHQVPNIGVGRLNVSKGLSQVDDVNAVALTEDEPLHLRIPSAGLVSEVDPGIEQLTHRHDWRHGFLLSQRFSETRGQHQMATVGCPER